MNQPFSRSPERFSAGQMEKIRSIFNGFAAIDINVWTKCQSCMHQVANAPGNGLPKYCRELPKKQWG
jgi:hypothetical protein